MSQTVANEQQGLIRPLAARGQMIIRHRLALLLSLVLMAALGLGALAPAQAAADVGDYARVTNFSDDLARSVGSGWGTAQLGGRYTIDNASALSVARHGVVRLRSGQAASARLTAIRTVDQYMATSLVIPFVPTDGNGIYVVLELRRQVDGSRYGARLRVAPGGHLYVSTFRENGSGLTLLAGERKLASVVHPGQTLNLEGYSSGLSQVSVGVRAWTPGLTAPWVVGVDHSNLRITRPGHVGLWAYLSRGTAPTSLWVTRFSGAKLINRVPAPPKPPAPPTQTSGPVGSMSVGSTSYAVPTDALIVAPNGNDDNAGTLASPLKTVAAAVSRARSGQTVVLRGGNYHQSVFLPASKVLTIQAYPHEAVWFDGSVPVTNWTRRGDVWMSTGWRAQFDHSASDTRGSDAGGYVSFSHPMAAYPDQLFMNGHQLQQVSAFTTPRSGEFAVMDASDTLVVGSDPGSADVRASTLEQAIVVAGKATLRGFGIHRYATPLPDMGTVFLGGSTGGSTLENLVIDNNATQGLSVSVGGVTVRHVTSTNNGMVGIHMVYANGSAIKDSLVSGNNTQHFNAAPAAAGIKIGRSRHITVTGNTVTQNLGVNGIWLDESVVGFTIGNNVVSGPSMPTGIAVELSDTGSVVGNRVSGAVEGVTIYNSGNVQIYNNWLGSTSLWDIGLTQDERRQATSSVGRDPRYPVPDPAVPWMLTNITIANNAFANPGGGDNPGYQVYALDKRTHVPVDNMHVVITGNLFSAQSSTSSRRMVAWGAGDNHTIEVFTSPLALSIAKGSMINALTTNTDLNASFRATQRIAVALPAAIAALLGVRSGTRVLGPVS